MALALRTGALLSATIEERQWRLCISNMFVWVLLPMLLTTTRAQENTGSASSFPERSSHWVHVQKCCPESHMMVEVARDPSTVIGIQPGTKFECQLQNDTSFRWAPDYIDEQDNIMPFEANVEQIEASSSEGDFNITKFCIHQGPCISTIVGKPQCGPVNIKP